MSFFDTLQEATQQERHELFNLPIIRDDVALGPQSRGLAKDAVNMPPKASTRAKPPATVNTMTPRENSPAKPSRHPTAAKAITLKASCCKKPTSAAAFTTPKAAIKAK